MHACKLQELDSEKLSENFGEYLATFTTFTMCIENVRNWNTELP